MNNIWVSLRDEKDLAFHTAAYCIAAESRGPIKPGVLAVEVGGCKGIPEEQRVCV